MGYRKSFGGKKMPDARGNKISCSNYQCEIELTVEILSEIGKGTTITVTF